MTSQHTPGPWWFALADPEGNCFAGAGDRQLSVAISRPDARLIAAAPDLLAALVEAQEALDVLADDAADAGLAAKAEAAADLAMRLRTAIAKATGD
jgi:hypothetical protein